MLLFDCFSYESPLAYMNLARPGTSAFFAENLLNFPYVRGLLTAHECYTDYRADMTNVALVLIRILLEILWLYSIAELCGDFADFAKPASWSSAWL